MPDAPIVAIGLLTQRDLERLGDSFRSAIPVPPDAGFEDLLLQLDGIEVEPLGRGVLLRRYGQAAADHDEPAGQAPREP